MRQTKLVLGIDGLDPSGVEVLASTIETGLMGNAALSNSATTFLPFLASGRAALHNAIHAAHPDTVVIKDAQNYVIKVLIAIKGSVELECNNNDMVATSSGFGLKQITASKPKVFNATQGLLTGTVDLVAPYAGTHAAYVWEMVSDPINQNTWSQLKITNNTSYLVTGLTAGNKYWFRVKAIVRDDEQPYTDPHQVHVV